MRIDEGGCDGTANSSADDESNKSIVTFSGQIQ